MDEEKNNASDNEDVFCNTCGEKIPPGSDECPNCAPKSKMSPKGLLIVILSYLSKKRKAQSISC